MFLFNDFITNNMWPVSPSEGDEVWLLVIIIQQRDFEQFSPRCNSWYGGFAGTELL